MHEFYKHFDNKIIFLFIKKPTFFLKSNTERTNNPWPKKVINIHFQKQNTCHAKQRLKVISVICRKVKKS
jgi:hypothetical protein